MLRQLGLQHSSCQSRRGRSVENRFVGAAEYVPAHDELVVVARQVQQHVAAVEAPPAARQYLVPIAVAQALQPDSAVADLAKELRRGPPAL